MGFSRWGVSTTTAYSLLGIIGLYIFAYFNGCKPSHEHPEYINSQHGFLNVLPDHHFPAENRGKQDPKDLLTNTVPPTVHYIWCQETSFEFQHFLSVLSVYKTLKPTEIIFHYRTYPVRDDVGYYQHLDELLRDLPNFFTELIEDVSVCADVVSEAVKGVENILRPHGGVFIGTNIVVSPEFVRLMNSSTVEAPEHGLFSERGLIVRPTTTTQTITPIRGCVNSSQFRLHIHYCVYVPEEIFPFQIFDLQTDFGSLARLTGYGTEKPLLTQSQSTLSPNIVHYVWLGNNWFSFFNYLSVLSSLYIQNVDSVFIHGNYEPRGVHWEKLKKISRVKYIYRDFYNSIYGRGIYGYSHSSDVLRFDILHRYGGIYLDWDVLWVNPLSEKLRQYEAVSGVDWPKAGKYPNTINMGVVLGKKGAKYFKFMTESFRHYVDRSWEYNAVNIPYKVFEHNPETLHIETRLQIICFSGKCHPAWIPGFRVPLSFDYIPPPFDWKTDVWCVHWTFPDPDEYSDQQTLLSSHSMYAEIGVNVLKKAGMI